MGEETPEFYDEIHRNITPELLENFYRVWHTALSFINPSWRVLDVGCGRGEFGRLCVDKGCQFSGIDFSAEAVKQARRNTPNSVIYHGNIFENTKLISSDKYEIITLTEFLEHIEEDLEIIRLIPSTKKVFISIPNYGGRGHVRFFSSLDEVYGRYGDMINIETSSTLTFGPRSKIYCIYGVRK